MNAIEQRQELIRRDAQICIERRELPPTHPGYSLLSDQLKKIRDELFALDRAAAWEEIDAEWPQGMPAHP